MKFKEQLVFVETDAAGGIALENGRASMRYRLEDERVYHPWPGNLTALDDGKGSAGTPKARSEKSAITEAQYLGGAGPRARRSRQAENAIVAYTDGACIGNPGRSGLGYVITWPDGKRILRGEPLGDGTNNIAELTAILRVLEVLDGATQPVAIYTDSEYSIGVLVRKWKPKANQELIRRIKEALARFDKVQLRKVPAHTGIRDNELVDQLAREAARDQRPVGSSMKAAKEA
jgi:ribonuclease HI